jgi:anti-sigma regulatory factor (Ser/Thr protein kinase)
VGGFVKVSDSYGDRAPEQRLMLGHDPGAVREAREFVAALLDERKAPPEAVDRAMLVASELVTNALEHGEGRIELRIGLGDDRVRIEVIDEGADQAPAVRQQTDDQTGGWGLQIVDQLAVQWGVFEGTTHVWADLGLR